MRGKQRTGENDSVEITRQGIQELNVNVNYKALLNELRNPKDHLNLSEIDTSTLFPGHGSLGFTI